MVGDQGCKETGSGAGEMQGKIDAKMENSVSLYEIVLTVVSKEKLII